MKRADPPAAAQTAAFVEPTSVTVAASGAAARAAATDPGSPASRRSYWLRSTSPSGPPATARNTSVASPSRSMTWISRGRSPAGRCATAAAAARTPSTHLMLSRCSGGRCCAGTAAFAAGRAQ